MCSNAMEETLQRINTLYQDNMSTMQIEKNGRKSAGQKSRHINIRYFFIKDRVQNGEARPIQSERFCVWC